MMTAEASGTQQRIVTKNRSRNKSNDALLTEDELGGPQDTEDCSSRQRRRTRSYLTRMKE